MRKILISIKFSDRKPRKPPWLSNYEEDIDFYLIFR